jgi:hypothetical protein
MSTLRFIRLDRHAGWTLQFGVERDGVTHKAHERFDPGDRAEDVAEKLLRIAHGLVGAGVTYRVTLPDTFPDRSSTSDLILETKR